MVRTSTAAELDAANLRESTETVIRSLLLDLERKTSKQIDRVDIETGGLSNLLVRIIFVPEMIRRID